MTHEEVDLFEKISLQLTNLHEEMSILSKKNPDGPINKFKLKHINEILISANDILDEETKPFDEFQLFEEDEMPTNSDVVLILSQYLSCFEKFRINNIDTDDGISWYWLIDGKLSGRGTLQPKLK